MDVETARAEPRSPVSCLVKARGHEWVQDKPAELGGDDTGPMASELLLGSLLACQLSTFRKVADKRRLRVDPVSLEGELHFDERGDMARIRLRWVLSSAEDDARLDAVVRLTDRACTISKALAIPVEATYSRG